MLLTELGKGEKDMVKKVMGPSTTIVTNGRGKMIAEGKTHELESGYVFFVGPGVDGAI